MDNKDFVALIYENGKDTCEYYGIPVEVCIAQAVQETGWGKYISAKNNFWGIKGNPSNGTLQNTMEDKPTEAYFSNFDNLSDAVACYCRSVKGIIEEKGYTVDILSKDLATGLSLLTRKTSPTSLYYAYDINYDTEIASIVNDVKEYLKEINGA